MEKLLILGFGKTGHCVFNKLKNKYDTYVFDRNKIFKEDIKYLSYEDLKNKLPLFDLVIRSPGVSITSEEYKLACLLSKRVYNDIEYILSSIKTKNIVCITGSNGKTTVGRMISTLLKSKYHVHFLGNVGEPLISKIDEIEKDDILILELSSFNLENISSLKSKVSIITSLSSNHLNAYDNLEMYLALIRALSLKVKPSSTISPSKPISFNDVIF